MSEWITGKDALKEFSLVILPPQVQNLTNIVYGKLTAKTFVEVDKHHSAVWICVCSCGKELQVSANHLKTGNTKSCGCLQVETIRSINSCKRIPKGKRFGKLIILGLHSISKDTKLASYSCVCDCGKYIVRLGHSMQQGLVKSCGCKYSDAQNVMRIARKIVKGTKAKPGEVWEQAELEQATTEAYQDNEIPE